MMQLARRILLVAVLLLLASVGTACAECAWVLWAHSGAGSTKVQGGTLIQPPRYEPVESYTSRDACVAAQRNYRLNPGWDRTICLPDTVKPQ